MSEETSSRVPSDETARPEPTPEPSPAGPPKGGKKKLWIVIAAVAVVALLIGSSVYVMFLAPMKVSMDPADAELTVDAGKMLSVSVKVKKGISDITDDDGVKYLWTVLPNTLGSWQRRADPSVNLTAAKVEGTGTVTCVVEYKGETVTVSKPLSVLPPYLDQILVTPPTKTMERGLKFNFTASAIDSVADPIPGLVYTWSMVGDVADECELNVTTGPSVEFTSGPTYGSVTLTATATHEGVTKSGLAQITIGPLPPRSVDYYWYDMFDVPFGEWWDMRASVTGIEVPLTHEYPYLFQWNGFPEGNMWIYTNMRLNITAENVSEVNMNERPEFLPLHGNARGGNAVINWYLQYLTSEEMKRFPDATSAWNDGWVVSLNGTATLDEQAALSVLLGLTAEGFDDFDSWWSLHKGEVKNDFGDWFKYEAGPQRLDIFPAYDYAFTTLAWNLDAEKVGDKIVLEYDLVTWGAEMLLSMWIREAFMPTEYYFEDMYFNANIGPEWATVHADTAVAYAAYAYESTLTPGEPCWAWEALLQDYVVAGPPENRESLYNVYEDKEYLNTAPGSPWYGKMMQFDYVPGAWNLSENETLTIEWPGGEQLFKVHVGNYLTADYYNEMEMNFSEPYWSDAADLAPGAFSIDNESRQIVFTGPIDMWHWSQSTTDPAHEYLSSEWTRLEGLMPYGAPYVEFKPKVFIPAPAKLAIGVPDLVVMGDTASVDVTCLDQFGRLAPTYEGTVTFSSNRSGEVTFPSDYTFTLSDEGTVTLPGLSFSALGWFNITVSDKDNESIAPGWTTNVYVVEFPEVIDHFTVEVPGLDGLVVPGMPADVHVTAHNQYDNRIFRGYDGTVSFSTNASEGNYVLPDNFTFDPSMNGFAIIPGLVFKSGGVYSLTVFDNVTTSATDTTSVSVIFRNPSIDYRVYDMLEEPWGEWWPYRLDAYRTDILLSNESGAYTMVYNPDTRGRQGLIMAPYRWNVSATNISTISVDNPMIMPVFGPEAGIGAEAEVDVYFQYLYQEWWDDYWLPRWSTNDGWNMGIENLIVQQTTDGYYAATVYEVRMNREAAETFLNMPQAADPVTWWTDNGDAYIDDWVDWILDQGNNVYDIYAGYEWAYIDLGTLMDIVVDGDDIVLNIAHFNWGFEVLITRWMTASTICTHEPYMEDIQLVADLKATYSNLTYDAVAQYNLHAVKANLTESDAAWVWEPQHIDYISWPGSEFNPWDTLQYTSWNSGDAYFGEYVNYDFTPTEFDLTDYMTLTFEFPTGDNVIGYRGLPTPLGSIALLKTGDAGAYENITVYGYVELGYHLYPDVAGVPDLSSMYDNDTKVLAMQGPMDFDNFRQPNETGVLLLYHSAPWIEFNVANLTWPGATLSLPGADVASSGSMSSAMWVAMVAMALSILLSIVATVSVVSEVRREDD